MLYFVLTYLNLINTLRINTYSFMCITITNNYFIKAEAKSKLLKYLPML